MPVWHAVVFARPFSASWRGDSRIFYRIGNGRCCSRGEEADAAARHAVKGREAMRLAIRGEMSISTVEDGEGYEGGCELMGKGAEGLS
jgi:hypothetical protein